NEKRKQFYVKATSNRRPEWINNVRAGSFACQGNHIKASSKLVAFNTEQAGKTIKVWQNSNIPLYIQPGSDGQRAVTQISCHSDLVTDMDFSPFDESLLATCSVDETVKLWRLCDLAQEQSSSPELTLRSGQGRLELVLFHPTSSGLLAVGTTKSAQIWDTNCQEAPLAGNYNQQLMCSVSMRSREVRLWDSRKLSSSLSSVSLDVTTSRLSYPDPSLLLILTSIVSHCLTDTSTKGIALVPKLALDVMSCEVVRVLQLTDSCIVPISYQVPRKFHDDLYPDTVDPYFQKDQARDCSTSSSPLSTPSSSAAPSRSPSSTSGLSSGFVPSPSPSQSAKAFQNLMGPTSKFRHIQGTVMHRDTHITNIRGLNLTTPGECDGFCVNRQRVAVPLAIAGGQIAVFERSQPGKLPDTALPTIQNSVNVADFAWDPFDTHRLAVAGDDAKIRVWQVPEGGLKETLTEPKIIMQGHTEKIYSIKFHPLASGVLVSSSYDLTVRLWNLETGKQVKVLDGHQDQVFGMAWSPDGKLLATVCKDGKVRIYDPRKSTSPLQEGPGPEGHRGARVVWVCDGKYLLVSGFDSRSERGLYLYSASSLSSGAVSSVPVNVSPSTLIPYYDPDTSVVILTGKGDTRVYIYEIFPEDPYFIECSSFNSPEPHKGLAFLPKTECNVRDVEVAVGLMLTKTTIEPVAFKVPRVKKEFFQDDVYSDTAVWWEPALTGSAWLSGSNGLHKKISLKPKDMTPVSEAPKEAPVRKYLPSSVYLEEKTDEQKKDELLNAMVAKLGNMDDPLPQESFEGVDEDEWVSECDQNMNV
uniref:Coronin n=1 Tax=Oreochromis niloticus TaxID=8128 RepID=A0A669B8Q6_ORENI